MRSTLRTSRLLTLLLSGLLAFGATACSPKGDANSSQNDGVAQQGKSKPQDVDGVDQDINTENPNEGAAGQVTTGGKDGSGTPTENGGTPGDEAGADQTGGGSTSGGTPANTNTDENSNGTGSTTGSGSGGANDTGGTGVDTNNGNSGIVGGKGSGTQTSDTDESQDGQTNGGN